MASNRGYTTATKVRDVMGGMVIGVMTDAMIDSAITRIEAIIDCHLKVGSETGAYSLTWATAKTPHWVLEGAATYGAALQLCGPSILSWNTLDQLINAQNLFSYMFKAFMDVITTEDLSSHIQSQ